MTRLINLTPHNIVIVGVNGAHMDVPPSGQVARCATIATDAGSVVVDGNTVRLRSVKMGDISGLPAPQDGVMYIVSQPVLQAAKLSGRVDCCSPDTNPDSVIRDPSGQIIGVKGLII